MMVVNAALFQDIPPAAGAAGAKGGGATDPQGGGFARILNGHAAKDAAGQSDAPGESATQFRKSSAAAGAEASRSKLAQKEEQVEQSAQEEPLLETVKELTAKAQAQQQSTGEAAEVVAVEGKAGEGNAPVAADSGKVAAPAGEKENLAASEPGGEVNAGTTSQGQSQLPLNGSAVASSPAGAMTVAALPGQQVVAQNAAQLQVNSSATSGGEKSHAAHHARRKGGEGEAVSGGTKATEGKEQAQQDAPATLAAMLMSGAAMVTAGGSDLGAIDADGGGELADITAPAGFAGNGVAAKAETLPQVAAQGEQSPQLEALQQKVLKLAAAEPEVAVPQRSVPQVTEPTRGGGGAAQQVVQSATKPGPAQAVAGSAAAAPQQAAAPAEKPVAPQRFVAMPVAGGPFQVVSGMTAGGDQQPAAGAAPTQVVGDAVAATSDKVAEVAQDGEKEPQQAQNALELSGRQTQNSGNGGAVITATDPAATNPTPPEITAAQAPGKQDAQAVAAERKQPRETETGHHAGDGEKIAAEPAAVNQKTASTEISGTKTAVTAASPRLAAQESTGGNGSGDTGEKGHQEQKAQNQIPQTSPATAGMMQFTARELSQPAATPSSPQNALHESLLSQVKEAVVSHDGKGNGEMSIRLNPGELGELKIQVRMEDNRVRVEVQADNKVVKDLLLSNLDSLKDALAGKNLAMEGFDVSTGSGGGFNSPLPEQQREAAQQQAFARNTRPVAYDAPEQSAVNYMTAEVNSLLDVRF